MSQNYSHLPNDSLAVSVVVPAYLEAATIVESVERMLAQFHEDFRGAFEIIVVIDGDVVETSSNLKVITDSRVRVVRNSKNRGKGSALRDGFKAAKAPFVAQLDADLDLHPRNVGVLYKYLRQESCDAVVGSKFHAGSEVAYPNLRRFQSRMYQFIVQMMFGLRLSDTQTGVKVFSREALISVIDVVTETGFVFDLDLLAAMSDSGYQLAEGPVRLDYQFSSSLPPWAAVVMMIHTMRVWRRAKKRRPQLRHRDREH